MSNAARLTALFLFIVSIDAGMPAGEVSVVDGAIVFVSSSGVERKLTAGPLDSDPSLCPDGKHVVFIRNYAGSKLPPDVQPRPQNFHSEIWQVGVDGKQPLLLFSREVHYKQFAYDSFSSPKMGADGRYVYFFVLLEVVSDGLVRLGLTTGDVKVLMPAQTLVVVQTGPYRGFLIVQRRMQAKEGAAYPFWLLSPDGDPVRQIGDEDAVRAFLSDQQQ